MLLRGGGKEKISLGDGDRIQMEIDGEERKKEGEKQKEDGAGTARVD